MPIVRMRRILGWKKGRRHRTTTDRIAVALVIPTVCWCNDRLVGVAVLGLLGRVAGRYCLKHHFVDQSLSLFSFTDQVLLFELEYSLLARQKYTRILGKACF
jgi:hypothetical protein